MRDLADLEGNELVSNHRDDDEEAEASSSGTTTNFDSSTNTTPKDNSTTQSSTLARTETRAVNRSKILVLFVLTLAAISVSVATYFFTKKTEKKEFEGKVSTVST